MMQQFNKPPVGKTLAYGEIPLASRVDARLERIADTWAETPPEDKKATEEDGFAPDQASLERSIRETQRMLESPKTTPEDRVRYEAHIAVLAAEIARLKETPYDRLMRLKNQYN